jgi:non-heme chloroperoxidase
VSDETLRPSWNIPVASSPKGALDSVDARQTDLRKDLQRIDVSTLVIHGHAGRIVPFPRSGRRTAEAVKLVAIEGGPHGITSRQYQSCRRRGHKYQGV